ELSNLSRAGINYTFDTASQYRLYLTVLFGIEFLNIEPAFSMDIKFACHAPRGTDGYGDALRLSFDMVIYF
ncbi:MAG: hypothetical protein LAT67_14290, partial [Balneolales bacterium]|nr:hypothetical protein [Balneolales bacterium]